MYDIHAISALTDGPDGEACNVVGLFILCVCVCVRVTAVAIILSQHSVHSAVCTIQCILGRHRMTILLTLLTLKGCTLSMYNNSQLNHYREICFQQYSFLHAYTDTEVAL